MHRDGLVGAVALFFVVLTACTSDVPGSRDPSPPNAGDRPNVLVIVTDDQPNGTMSVMPKTRRYFGEQGVTFTRAHSTTPACCPARASIMTGRYAHNHLALTNEDAYELDQDTTVQAHLQAAGYRTGLVGKFLNLWKGRPPNFDRWALKLGSRRARYFDTSWEVDGRDKQTTPGYWTTPFTGYTAEFLEGWEERDDEPWFLWLAIPAPHAPYLPEPAYADASVPVWEAPDSIPEEDKSDKPPYVQEADARPGLGLEARTRQLRSLLSADDVVADVMQMLDELGEDNTLAFFTSDNGYLWGQHGLLGTFLSKGNPYWESVNVPMLMRWPGQVEAGTTDGRLVGLLDIAPTIYEATGVRGPSMDGRSLLGDDSREWILNEFWQKEGAHRSTVPDWTAMRTADFSYVEYLVEGKVVFREYYDLASDPYELENLLGDSDPSNDPDIRSLERRLDDARRCEGRSCP